MQKELQFSVDSALLKELGEKLVETVHLALSELVKNSYDADASNVTITFGYDDNGISQIIVEDNGVGMNFKEVQNYWMKIATTHKEAQNVSKIYGRPLTGAKGIGRFSCRRLGTILTLVSIGTSDSKSGKLEKTTVTFPWLNFEAGGDVTGVKCKGDVEYVDGFSTGTKLIITNAVDEWSLRGMNWLKRQLAVLSANRGQSRQGFKDDPGFNVFIQEGDQVEKAINLRDELIDAGWGTLTAKINDKSQAVCELVAMNMTKKTVVSSRIFENLKDVKLKVGIMVPNHTSIRNKSVLSGNTMSDIIAEWGGVQVKYRDFRVAPYGDDDWLSIDKDRGNRRARSHYSELSNLANSIKGVDPTRYLLNMLGMRNHVGEVSIGEEAAGFEMKASREGFLNSPATVELVEFCRFAIDWATIMRDYSIRQEEEERIKKAEQELATITKERVESNDAVSLAVELIESSVKSLTHKMDAKSKREVKETFAKATEVIRQKDKANHNQLNHLRLIASTSTLLLVFQHEVKSLLGLLELHKNSLERISQNIGNKTSDEIREVGNDFNELSERLKELLEMTSLMTENHTKSKRGQVALKSRVEKVTKVFALITTKYKVEIDYSSIKRDIALKDILEAEVYSILLNVLSNSIKAVIAKRSNRKIEVLASKNKGKVEIIIRDTGIGISENRFEEVFTPYISDPDGNLYSEIKKELNPEDNMIVGTGSGLGLGIVKEIVSANGGAIEFVKPEKGWSSELIIRLK